MSQTTIVPAGPHDLATVQHLARIIWHAHYPGIITTRQIDYMLDRDYTIPALEQSLHEGVSIDLVLVGDVVRGFAAYGPTRTSGDENARAKLHKLYLDTSFHGQGIGSILLGHVEQKCREFAGVVTLAVNKHNARAILAYHRHGFAVTQSVLQPIGDGFFMDDYIMSKTLTAKE